MEIINLTTTWIGIVGLIVFIIGYFFIAAEEKYQIDKAKPALFIGTFLFIFLAIYYKMNNLPLDNLESKLEHQILEIAEIFFFLYVAMTYIETLVEFRVFEVLKYNLVSKGYSYKKIFWLTGIITFFLSPVADNLTTALIMSTVLITIDRKNVAFLVPGAINIVVASNAGGAWSPFGDITTLMTWTAEKGKFGDFAFLFVPVFGGYLLNAFLLSLFVPKGEPHFDASIPKPEMKRGAKTIIFLGIFTIAMAVASHQFLHIPAMWGMMFGLALLKLYGYNLKRKGYGYNVFHTIGKIEHNTLMFFFGILAAVGALHAMGWLELLVKIYAPDVLGPTFSNILVGIISAVIDNVPVMSAILKANPDMGLDQWMLVTMTVGIGGSLISFGSAAGVGVMGRLHGIYTFSSHLKYGWTVAIGYIASIALWYIQYEILGIGV